MTLQMDRNKDLEYAKRFEVFLCLVFTYPKSHKESIPQSLKNK